MSRMTTRRLNASTPISSSTPPAAAIPTLDLLKVLGRPSPPETVIGVDLTYATAVFETPADAPSDWKAVITFPRFGESTRGGLLAPMENGHWILGLGGRQEDAPAADEAGFLAFAQGLRTQTIYNAVKNAKRIGEIAPYGFRESAWRHFDRADPLPAGLIPFADSICRFNPVYGQGMSVAALEGGAARRASRRWRRRRPGSMISRPSSSPEAQDIVRGPWEMSAIPDFANPLTRGERPANLQEIFRFGAAFFELAMADPAVHKLDAEVRALLKPPSALADPLLVAKVMEVMSQMAVPA